MGGLDIYILKVIVTNDQLNECMCRSLLFVGLLPYWGG